jgi:hypothetical protein
MPVELLSVSEVAGRLNRDYRTIKILAVEICPRAVTRTGKLYELFQFRPYFVKMTPPYPGFVDNLEAAQRRLDDDADRARRQLLVHCIT